MIQIIECRYHVQYRDNQEKAKHVKKMTIIVIAIYLHKYYTWYMSIIFLFSDKKTGRKTCVQVFSNDIIIPILKKRRRK